MAEIERVLRLARERMADPDKVVLNPDHLFEDADGTRTYRGGAVRACLIGHVQLAVREVGTVYPAYHDARRACRDAAHRLGFEDGAQTDACTAALVAGRHLEVLDAALESSKLGESPGDTPAFPPGSTREMR